MDSSRASETSKSPTHRLFLCEMEAGDLLDTLNEVQTKMQKSLEKLMICMLRASRGEELTIGFLGGSITQGSVASSHELTYAYRVYQWWCESFPKAVFHYVNGGIGGTTSHFGAARAVDDVLMYQPDVVFVDFSVNDDATLFFQETYEGVIRRLLTWPSNPAVVVLNNVFYDTGSNAQEYHNAVAAHYQIPCVSIRDTIYRKIWEGIYTAGELTPDNLHPNDKGHGLVAQEVIRLLEAARGELDGRTTYQKQSLPAPLTPNAYQQARRLNITNTNPRLCGFRADTEEKKGHLDVFKNGWLGSRLGDKIVFEIEASCIAVQYRKTIHKPSPTARAVLDGNKESSWLLEGNFEETWGDCLYLEVILHHGQRKLHTVEIEIVEAGEEIQTPFYLLSLIIA